MSWDRFSEESRLLGEKKFLEDFAEVVERGTNHPTAASDAYLRHVAEHGCIKDARGHAPLRLIPRVSAKMADSLGVPREKTPARRYPVLYRYLSRTCSTYGGE